MFNRFELTVGGVIVGLLALAFYLTQFESTILSMGSGSQVAQLATTEDENSPVSIISEGLSTANEASAIRAAAYLDASDNQGNINRMVIDDIKIGTGPEVEEGDTVSVHYVGTFQGGEEFDNSKKRGAPLEFRVGSQMVIEGWDQGLVGMQVGGERVLVIPPELGYGATAVGPIPANSTLVFTIELLEIK
jgi:FKBP-type peptidyl-prolyl cis-trans isomerase